MRQQLEKRAHETALNNPIRLTGSSSENAYPHNPPISRRPRRGRTFQVRPLARIHSSLEKKLDPETLRRPEARNRSWWSRGGIPIQSSWSKTGSWPNDGHGHIAAGHKTPVLAIYADGGGIHKKVGASAVDAQAYFGNETTAMVYAAELTG